MGGQIINEEDFIQKEEEVIVDEKGGNEIKTEKITINGINIPLYKEKYETTQDFVKKLMKLLYKNNFIPDNEIKNLLNKDYCNETFDVPFPIFQNDPKMLLDRKGHSRYWSNKVIGDFYICSQWWKQKEKIYDEKLAKWILKISKYNVKTNGI